MPVVPETEFVRAFDRYSAEARREVVTVTRQGHVVGAFLSPDDLKHFERLKRREREALVTGALPDDVVAEIEAAEYGAGPQ